MNQQQLTIMAHKFQSVLDADVLNERGEQLGFCQRQRLITPLRFGLSVIASMATEQVASLAAFHRQFNDLWDGESTYKAFYNQVLKASCGEFLRTSLCDIMGKLTWKVLGCEAGQLFAHATTWSFKMARRLPSIMRSLTSFQAGSIPSSPPLLHSIARWIYSKMPHHDHVLSPDTDAEHAYLPSRKVCGAMCSWPTGVILIWPMCETSTAMAASFSCGAKPG
jgi:hypothetical protein